MKTKILLAAIAIMFGFASYAVVVPTVVWTNNLDTVQNGYAITLGDGCSISDGAAVIGTSRGVSIALSNNPSSVSVLVKYSNCTPQSTSAVAVSAYISVMNSSSSHELGVRSNGGNTSTVTGYWQGGSDYTFGDVTLPESGYMLFSVSSYDGTRFYVGTEISSLAGGENSSLHFSNSGVGSIALGGTTGTQSSVHYASWDGLVVEQIAIFENRYLSDSNVKDFVFEKNDDEPQAEPTIAEALDTNIGTFSFSGVSDWYVDDAFSLSGSYSVRSGSITTQDNVWNYSTMTMNLCLKEAVRLSFWYKVSCYDYTSYDRLRIVVDNLSWSYSGQRDWSKITQVLIPGEHTIVFEYGKRYNYTSGSECAWVDNISIEPIMPEANNVEVTNIKCQQRYPWNGMVDIDYTVRSEDPNAEVWVYPIGYDKDSNTSMAPRSLTGDGVDSPVSNGTFRMTWKVTDDYPEFHSTSFTVKMIALTGSAPYMVVDLSGGVDALSYPVTYLSSVPEGGWDDEYKTTKLVLRLIPPGSFMMGSPSDENGRGGYEDLHGVVLTKPFYIGVFEVTQKQYQLVMGGNPSSRKGDARPVTNVSYNDIRGSVNGVGWPTHNQVDADSFMGRLRSKVNVLFDLPTEAQWEYACRAGTSTGLNSGKQYAWSGENCYEVARWARNSRNSGSDYIYDGKGGYTYSTKVGCYLENAWGLYDMHGNVREWCLDYYYDGLGVAGVVDPKGSSNHYSNGERVFRGGSYDDSTAIRSAYRVSYERPTYSADILGFRVMCSPVAE